jgi:hypothetical protein
MPQGREPGRKASVVVVVVAVIVVIVNSAPAVATPGIAAPEGMV